MTSSPRAWREAGGRQCKQMRLTAGALMRPVASAWASLISSAPLLQARFGAGGWRAALAARLQHGCLCEARGCTCWLTSLARPLLGGFLGGLGRAPAFVQALAALIAGFGIGGYPRAALQHSGKRYLSLVRPVLASSCNMRQHGMVCSVGVMRS